jgi:hypothetical protein
MLAPAPAGSINDPINMTLTTRDPRPRGVILFVARRTFRAFFALL